VAAHRVVVRRHDTRADEDVIVDDRMRRQKAVRLDPDVGPDRDVAFDSGAAADHAVRANHGVLAHLRLIAYDRAVSDPGARVDDRASANRSLLPDDQRLRRRASRRRSMAESRLLSEYGPILDLATVAYDSATVDDHATTHLEIAAELHFVPDHQTGRKVGRVDAELHYDALTGELQPLRRTACLERTLKRLEYADDPQSALAAGLWLGAASNALHEVPALDAKRLFVRDLRAHDVP
jgi:hypothetical protein